MYRVLFLAAMLGISAPVAAQDAAPTPSPTAAGQKEHAPLTGRKLACQQAAKQKGLHGPEMGDEITVCVEEAKLDCLKQAVAQKARGPERKTFIETCLAKPS